MMINLNGHTINRGLTEYEHDGEVIYIDENADVIINGGSISDNIAEIVDYNAYGGGLRLFDSEATLKKVIISGNSALNGAAISSNAGCMVTLEECLIENNNFNSYGYTFYATPRGSNDFYRFHWCKHSFEQEEKRGCCCNR